MTKRITLDIVNDSNFTWRAASRLYAVTAYGRTVSEAKSRLYRLRMAESENRVQAFLSGHSGKFSRVT